MAKFYSLFLPFRRVLHSTRLRRKQTFWAGSALAVIGMLFNAVPASAQSVSTLTTSGDQSLLLNEQSAATTFSEGAISSDVSIHLDASKRYQEVDGLGYALTQASAEALLLLPPSERQDLLHSIFNPNNGNAVSMLRITIGASDLSGSLYTYNEQVVSGENFVPNPSKRYYIDIPAHGVRIGATGADERPYTASGAPMGADFEWRFVDAGEGHWFIDRAAGGPLPRLRTNDTNMADMESSSADGWWEKWQLSAGEGMGTYFLSLPLKGFGNHDRLQVDDNLLVRMVDNDQSAGTWESFTFTEVGSESQFSLQGPDEDTLIPVLKEILAINPEIKILATPWTAPRWMKTNNAWIGGSLKTEYHDEFAHYFVQYIRAMASHGINIWGITPQNEPENGHNEPSMLMTASQQYDLVEFDLGPALHSAGLGHVKIIGFDHNCDNAEFPIHVAQSQYVDGSAFHLYEGDISTLSTVKNATGKNVYFTEQWTGFPEDQTPQGWAAAFDADFGWHMQNVVIGSLRNWSKAVLEWNLATSPSFAKRVCFACMGAFTVDEHNLSIDRHVSFYIIPQLSRYLQAGAVRIDSGDIRGDIHHVALQNPDGSLVVLAYNNSASAKSVSIHWQGRSLVHSIPARSAVTFTWQDQPPQDEPQRIQAEAYSGMSGVQTESSPVAEKGVNVGWIDEGDWMTYHVDLRQPGAYRFSFGVASLSQGGALDVEVAGAVVNHFVFSKTDGWQNWVEHTGQIHVPDGGATQLTIRATQSGWNLDWFEVEKLAPSPDSDLDGVTDNIDQCPNTPAGSMVDNRGCAITGDSDADGVADDKDLCPGTPAGTAVDANGCAAPSGEDCTDVAAYPNWERKDWAGGPNTHQNTGDLMTDNGLLYRANWYTNTPPGSDASWQFVGACH